MRATPLLIVVFLATAGGAAAWKAAAILGGNPPAQDAAAATDATTAAPRVDAGPHDTVAARDYFIVGHGIDRQYLDSGDPDDLRAILIRDRGEDAAPARWSFQVPKKGGGLELIFGFDDSDPAAPDALYLYGFKVESKSVDTELVLLPRPALIGTAANVLGGAPHVTPVSTSTTLAVTMLGKQAHVAATITGQIRSAWSRAAPLSIGAQRYEDVTALELGLDLKVTGNLFGLDVLREADSTFDGLLAKGFGYVEFDTGKDTYRLLPPPDSAQSSSDSGAVK